MRAFVPGALHSPGFDAIVPPIDASAVVHTRSSSRHAPDPLTAGLFPQRSPPRLLTGAACGGLGSPPARRTRRTYLHHWHSTVRAGDLLHRLTPLSGHTADRRIWRDGRSQRSSRSATDSPERERTERRLCTVGNRAGWDIHCTQSVSSGVRHRQDGPSSSRLEKPIRPRSGAHQHEQPSPPRRHSRQHHEVAQLALCQRTVTRRSRARIKRTGQGRVTLSRGMSFRISGSSFAGSAWITGLTAGLMDCDRARRGRCRPRLAPFSSSEAR